METDERQSNALQLLLTQLTQTNGDRWEIIIANFENKL
jgi:hypothetical protein